MSIFNNNKLDPFGGYNLFADKNKTNQQMNSMNLPSSTEEEEKKRKKAEQMMKLQNLADTLNMVNANKSGNTQGVAMYSNRLSNRRAEEQARLKAAEQRANMKNILSKMSPNEQAIYGEGYAFGGEEVGYRAVQNYRKNQSGTGNTSPNSYKEYLLTDSTPTQEEYLAFLDRNQKPASAGTMFEIVDGNNNDSFVGNISANEYQVGGYKKYEDAGIDTSQFKLKGLSAGTDAASTSGDKQYDSLFKKFRGTNQLIGSIQGLADQYAEEPLTGLAVGNAAQFVDSVIQNIDAAGNMLSGENYTNVQNSGFTTLEGKDFSDQLKQVSGETGVSESRVRDLAYLFAAARGQEGRGLSDKDYENALRIVSGGVGAKGKIKVLEDVAVRFGQEVQSDLDFVVRNLPADVDANRYSTLRGSLSTFVNPYSINMNTITPNNNDAVINNLLKKYGG
jgi:hypothetical protein